VLKAEKEQVVAELVERLRTSETLFVADYRGLSMSEIDGVRTELLSHGARFSVVKNTLTRRAAGAAGVEGLDEFLEGPTAIAFVGEGDMVAVAKTLSDTARRTRVLTIRGGILDRRPITADDVRNLASLPPTDVLRGQVLGAVVGPLTAIVGIFNAPLRELVGVLDARINQLGEQAGPAEAQTAEEPAAEAPAAEAPAAEEPADEQPADEEPAAEEAEAETAEESIEETNEAEQED
jgi:large subunit ribosomal protein L10